MARFVDSLKALFKRGPAPRDGDIATFRVTCGHCGESVTLRVNKSTDLQPDWDGDGGGYLLSKEAQDSKCFRVMRLTARFDREKKFLAGEVAKGTLEGPL
jgi:hypothetical protein